MRLTGKWARVSATVIMVCMLALLTTPIAGSNYEPFRPRFTTLRIGLQFGSTALPSANLRNVDGYGRGFDFGFFDGERDFVPIGAFTSETAITMAMDRNMVWNPSAAEGRGEFREGTSGNIVLGAFHVQHGRSFATFEEARALANQHTGGFVRYHSGLSEPFLVMIGQHTTRAAAETAMANLNIPGASVCSGTANTITVVRTGTNVILFEWEAGNTPLGVRPRPIGNENPETWFRGFRYNGAFSYQRRDGGLLTVINMVDIEDYVKGILPYEMSNTWPLEALKAQALTARTFAIRSLGRHASQGFDLCVEVHCQVYRGRGLANDRTDRAVDETRGMFVTFEGRPAETVYASSNGGASENVENVWVEARPYLRGVLDPFEAYVVRRIAGYNWTVRHTPAALTERLRTRITGFNLSTVAAVRVTRRSETGNAIGVTITDVNGRTHTLNGRSQILAGLGTPTLRFDVAGGAVWAPAQLVANDPAQVVPGDTQLFAIDGSGNTVAVPSANMRAITGDGNVTAVSPGGASGIGGGTGLVDGQFTIHGTGNGHQVGMSQWGAFAMAHYHNMDFRDIIHFYFTGVEITETYQR
ncbi:MAG: SpoIID/LytB domain-containing protein [Oscillospiraceae bacterium]|nr:SpoIID/LytB domain-containing protein [Oscillospiraceae bacterium]